MKGITGNPALDAYHHMAVTPVTASRGVDRVQAPATAHQPSPAAEVKISSAARQMATSDEHGVEAAKLEALREQIQRGEFRVDAETVAKRMLDGAWSGGT
jgi:flagellar biosynthesis anti-sigma factor FlgM